VTPPFRVGLTGGIGSGKSVVCDCFRKLGVPVIDADVIARAVVEPGQPALDLIRRRFGSDVLADDGHLRRRALRDLVFSDPEAKRALEAILHPRIRSRMQSEVEQLRAPYCILCIPLLLETGQQDLVDRILVIDAPLELRLRRVMRRDRCSEDQARAIVGQQLQTSERLGQADDIIGNQGSLEALCLAVRDLHRRYLDAARTPG